MAARGLAVVLPNFAGGGAERVALTLMSSAESRGIPISLIVFNQDGALRSLVPEAVAVHSLDCRRLRNAFLPLLRALRATRPCIVFSTFGYVNLGLLAMRSFLPAETRIVIREANLPSLSLAEAPRGVSMRRLYRILYPRADRVIATSERMANEFRRNFGLNAARLETLRNPVDVRRIRSMCAPPPRHPGAGLRFVAAGRLTRQKGIDRLIRLMSRAPAACHLDILGDGPDRALLEGLACECRVSERVTFRGHQANPYPYYAGADAFLLPSRWEGMPNVALEALACGTPVIASPESGGIAEVRDGAAEGAVTVTDVEAGFAAAIAGVSVRATRRLPANSLLPPEYEMSAVAQRFMAILDDVAHGASGAAR